MKILVFSPYYPPHIGGLENYVQELNEYLSQKKVDIIVFTPNIPNTTPAEESHGSIRIIRFPAFDIISGYPIPQLWNPRFWKLLKKLSKEKHDLVISQTRFFITSILALIFSRKEKIKWIHIEHGSDFIFLKSKIKTAIAKLYDRVFGSMILRKSYINVAISKAVSNFVSKFDSRPVPVIYRGFDFKKIDLIPPDNDTKIKHGKNTLICFIGRLFSSKGLIDLFHSLAKIQNHNFHCFVIGDGPEKKRMETLAEKLHLKKRVTFWGFQNFKKTIGILKISDIFVNPSYSEGLPTTLLEAAACRKAIIATHVGGTTEVIPNNDCGIIIEPKNPDLLKEKIEFLLLHPHERERLGNEARKYAVANFDWERNIQTFLQLFKEIKTNGKE